MTRSVRSAFAIITLVASAAPVAAQPGAGLLDNEVDALLGQWHEKTKTIKSLYAEFEKTTIDRTFGAKSVNKGSARYLYPHFARMDIQKDDAGHGEKHFILTEQPDGKGGRQIEIHDIQPEQKQIKIVEIPLNQANEELDDGGPLKQLIFGMDPKTAHARYDFKILKQSADKVQIRVTPKRQEERDEFRWAEVELRKPSFLPLTLTMQDDISTKSTYKFADPIITNSDEILRKHFQPWVPPKVNPKTGKREWIITRGQKDGPSPAPGQRPPSPRKTSARTPDLELR